MAEKCTYTYDDNYEFREDLTLSTMLIECTDEILTGTRYSRDTPAICPYCGKQTREVTDD